MGKGTPTIISTVIIVSKNDFFHWDINPKVASVAQLVWKIYAEQTNDLYWKLGSKIGQSSSCPWAGNGIARRHSFVDTWYQFAVDGYNMLAHYSFDLYEIVKVLT